MPDYAWKIPGYVWLYMNVPKFVWRAFVLHSPILIGQVDSLELPKTPEITEIIENFIKVTKHLTKLKDTSTNYVWQKSHFKN